MPEISVAIMLCNRWSKSGICNLPYFLFWKGEDCMNILRQSSEEEMIREYLRAEFSSSRYSDGIRDTMKGLALDEKIILSADMQSQEENRQRRELLGAVRGYGRNESMFERFPIVTDWKLCGFSQPDLEKIRYIHYSYWNMLSGGTHRPTDAAEMIRRGICVYEQSNEGFLRAASHIRNNGTFPSMFFLTADYEEYVIVEGHLRMTAYAMAPEYFKDIKVIVGKCAGEELKGWM